MREEKLELSLLTGEEEARMVHSALYLGDHETLTIILSTLSDVRRLRLLRHYQAIYGKKLSRTIEEVLAGDFFDICHSIVVDPSKFIVQEMQGHLLEFPKPKEEQLAALLCERSRDELIVIKDFYENKFSKSLETDFDDHLPPEASKWLKLFITWREADLCCTLQQTSRDAQESEITVPVRLTNQYVESKFVFTNVIMHGFPTERRKQEFYQKLLNLGMGISYGQDGPVISSLIKTRCSSHMRNVFRELRRVGKPHLAILESSIPQDTRERIKYILESIDNPELFNAKVLWASREQSGKFWRNVLTLRLTRNKEFFKKVEFLLNEIYHVRLQEEIKKDTGEHISILLKRLIKI